MSSYGLYRIQHAAQTEAARSDWEYVAAKATAAGYADLVAKYQPEEGAGWGKIDIAIKQLRNALGWPAVYQMREADSRGEREG